MSNLRRWFNEPPMLFSLYHFQHHDCWLGKDSVHWVFWYEHMLRFGSPGFDQPWGCARKG